jgi:hypothetical protein
MIWKEEAEPGEYTDQYITDSKNHSSARFTFLINELSIYFRFALFQHMRVWRLTRMYDMTQRRTAPGGFIRGKTSSAISGHSDVPCFLLLDDPANELFLPVGLGADRILTPDWWIF